MIAAAKSARFFQRQNVGGLLNDAEQIAGACFIAANFTQLFRGEEAAKRAGRDGRFRGLDGQRYLQRLIPLGLDHPERDAFGRARPNAWHLTQLRDQILKRGGVFRPSQRLVVG